MHRVLTGACDPTTCPDPPAKVSPLIKAVAVLDDAGIASPEALAAAMTQLLTDVATASDVDLGAYKGRVAAAMAAARDDKPMCRGGSTSVPVFDDWVAGAVIVRVCGGGGALGSDRKAGHLSGLATLALPPTWPCDSRGIWPPIPGMLQTTPCGNGNPGPWPYRAVQFACKRRLSVFHPCQWEPPKKYVVPPGPSPLHLAPGPSPPAPCAIWVLTAPPLLAPCRSRCLPPTMYT